MWTLKPIEGKRASQGHPDSEGEDQTPGPSLLCLRKKEEVVRHAAWLGLWG